MNLNYDIAKITHTLRDFYNATGINTNLVKADRSEICRIQECENNYCYCLKQLPSARKQCILSDRTVIEKSRISKKPEMHICHAGLIDIAIPIIYNNEILAFLILGQMKQNLDFSSIKNKIAKYGLDDNTMEQLYNNLPLFSKAKIESISNIAEMLTKNLLLENILKPCYNENLDKALLYINENYTQDLSIQLISKNINLSKSALYKLFHSHLNCTVNEYLNKLRVEKSIDMLCKTDLSIEEISRQVGFKSSAYYTITFKKIMETTPLKYRKLSNNKI